MKAVILAAGRGTRMGDLTEDTPKPLLEVNERPFLYHLMKNVKKSGIDDIAVVVSYKKEKVYDFIEEEFPRTEIIEQGEPLGTGHAVKVTKDFIDDDDFIVIMGDNLYSKNDIRTVSESEGNVIAGYEVDNPERYGVLEINDNKLVSIIEKPDNPPSNLINTGLYKFTSEIFQALDNIEKSPRGEYELTDAISIMAEEGKVHVYKLNDYWIDFGRPEDIPKVEKFLSED